MSIVRTDTFYRSKKKPTLTFVFYAAAAMYHILVVLLHCWKHTYTSVLYTNFKYQYDNIHPGVGSQKWYCTGTYILSWITWKSSSISMSLLAM